MTTDLRDSGVTLSPQEAEAVFELWAKRQADTEALRSRLTVRDMAEAMAISPSEVERLLSAVRASRAETPVQQPVKRVRPINTFLISVVAGIWMVVLAAACFAAYSYGWQARARRSTPPNITQAAEAGMDIDGNLPEYIAKGQRISFGGYVVAGESSRPVDQGTMAEVFKSILSQVAAPPSVSTATSRPDIAIVNALQQNKPELADDLIRFEKMTISSGLQNAEVLIPIPLTSDERVLRLVSEEQAKRINILASRAREQASGLFATTRR